MSFASIQSAVVAAGKAIKQELMDLIRTDLDDHESRLITAEAAIGRLPPISFDVTGLLTPPMAVTGALTYRFDNNTRVLAARLLVVTAGSTGTVEVDVEYKRGVGAWTSILNSPISAVYTSGDYFTTSGSLATQDFLAGDLLRLNINSVQTDVEDFSVYLENEAA
jgi:hypothetical protein